MRSFFDNARATSALIAFFAVANVMTALDEPRDTIADARTHLSEELRMSSASVDALKAINGKIDLIPFPDNLANFRAWRDTLLELRLRLVAKIEKEIATLPPKPTEVYLRVSPPDLTREQIEGDFVWSGMPPERIKDLVARQKYIQAIEENKRKMELIRERAAFERARGLFLAQTKAHIRLYYPPSNRWIIFLFLESSGASKESKDEVLAFPMAESDPTALL